ncbi:MAG: hypothetical protein JKY20_12395 [Alphaproteobacteria bacterium]|nr:hypothetical protein [Alphaproteobacteria bacterium]
MHENVRKNSLASRLINPFLVVCAVLVLAPWAGAYWSIFDQRDQAFEANVRQAARQVQNIENRILDLFNYSDNYLKSVRRTYLQEGGLPAVRAYMRAVPLDRTILSHITIIGPDGGPLSVSGHKLKPGVTAKDRAYFKFQQAATGDEVYLSTPRRGRNSDKFLVRLVRRITLADGKFGGVIFAAMEVKKFTHFFETLKVGPDSVVNLVGVDKTLRARSGYDLGEDAPTLDRSALWEHLKIANTGAFTETSVIDGLSRYYAFRQLDAYPLIVSVGVPTASLGLLDPKSIAQQISIAFLLSLVIVGALLMSWRERFASRRLSD